MQAIGLATAAADQIAVDRFLEMPFGNGKQDLRKGWGRLLIVNVQQPEWIEVERLNLRAAFFE